MPPALLVSWPFVGRHADLEQIDDAFGQSHLKAVLITGRPGVGKSRLAEEALRVARARGLPGAFVSASGIAATVPLSALAPILPPQVERNDPFALFAAVRDHLTAAHAGRRLVLAVDDIDLLDATSMALLAFLLAEDVIFVIAVVGAGAPPPEPLDALWRAGRAMRLDLGPFDRRGVTTLLHLTLAGPVTAPATQALWDSSQGNVLYLRELVALARAEGTLECDGGVWSLSGRLAPGAGIAALVERRLRDLTPADRRALDLLAACGPLGVDDVAAEVPDARLGRLEAAELITVRSGGRRQEITLAHPMHVRVLRAALPRLAARELLQNEIARVRHWGARRRGDALRIAGWQLDATGTADPELLTQAATFAQLVHDGDRARDLAAAALHHGPNARASIIFAEALADNGDRAAAEAALAEAAADASGIDAIAVAVARASNLYFGLGRYADARACLHTASGTDPMLIAMEAMIVAAAGYPVDALALLGEREPAPEPSTPHVLWLLARSYAVTATGDVTTGADLCRRANAAHLGLDARAGLPHPAAHTANLAHALLLSGALDDAARESERGQLDAAAAGAGALAVRFMWLHGRIELARGHPLRALTHFRAGLAEARRREHGRDAPFVSTLGPLAGALTATSITGAAEPGLVDAARLALAGQATSPEHVDLMVALAWTEACAGAIAAACIRLLAAAEFCRRDGRRAQEAEIRHVVVRLGHAADVTDRLAEIAAAADAAPLDGLRARHAAASATGSPEVLSGIAAEFAALGMALVAAEAYAQVAAVWLADGVPRSAARATARAEELASGCEGARTPGLLSPATVSPLSPREREIAILAARGVPSREIAELLFLSVRTVNNHLQSVYGKLGVSARTELAAALGTVGAGPEGNIA